MVAVSVTMLDRKSMVASPLGADRISRRTGLFAGSAEPPCGCSTLLRRTSTVVKVWRRSSEGTSTWEGERFIGGCKDACRCHGRHLVGKSAEWAKRGTAALPLYLLFIGCDNVMCRFLPHGSKPSKHTATPETVKTLPGDWSRLSTYTSSPCPYFSSENSEISTAVHQPHPTHHFHDHTFSPRGSIVEVLPQHGRAVQNTVEKGAPLWTAGNDCLEESRLVFPELTRESPRREAERTSPEDVSLEIPEASVELANNLAVAVFRGCCVGNVSAKSNRPYSSKRRSREVGMWSKSGDTDSAAAAAHVRSFADTARGENMDSSGTDSYSFGRRASWLATGSFAASFFVHMY